MDETDEDDLASLRAAHPTLDIRLHRQIRPWHRVLVWLITTCLFGALAPAIAMAVKAADDPNTVVDFHDFFASGTLLIVTVLASFAAMGDLALGMSFHRVRGGLWPWGLIVTEVLLIFTGALWYGDRAQELLAAGVAGLPEGMVAGSVSLYVAGAVVGSCCIATVAGGE